MHSEKSTKSDCRESQPTELASGDLDTLQLSTSLFEGDMFPEERSNVERYRGLQKELSRRLTLFWGIPDESIEIGATVLTKAGSITHIVHLMQRDALDIYAEEMFKDRDSLEVTPMSVIRRVYGLKNEEITKIFRDHFRFEKDSKVDFKV